MSRLSRNSRATAGYLGVAPAEFNLAAATHSHGPGLQSRRETQVGASRCTCKDIGRAFGPDHRAGRSRHTRDRQSCAAIDCRVGSLGSSPRPRARACAERKQHQARAGLTYRRPRSLGPLRPTLEVLPILQFCPPGSKSITFSQVQINV